MLGNLWVTLIFLGGMLHVMVMQLLFLTCHPSSADLRMILDQLSKGPTSTPQPPMIIVVMQHRLILLMTILPHCSPTFSWIFHPLPQGSLRISKYYPQRRSSFCRSKVSPSRQGGAPQIATVSWLRKPPRTSSINPKPNSCWKTSWVWVKLGS